MRPIGAFLFGRAADRYGRRPTLMVDVLLYSLLEFASGFAPNLTALIVLCALYGIAMGGEWGVGASLAMETIPPKSRGFVSGLLQAGYPSGYLVASVVYATLFPIIGWRGMFMIGVLPAFLVLYIRRAVPESPSWQATAPASGGTLTVLRSHWKLGLYAVLLMTAFNFYSPGTQDRYPTFLQVQHHFSPQVVGTIAVIYNIGAILGGISFGMLSQRIGRRRAIVLAALLSLPIVPLWAFSTTPILLAVGAFLMQFMVQGACGGDTGTPQRALSRPGAGYLPRFRLSARQPARLCKRHDTGSDRGSLRQRLRACAGACRCDCRNHHSGNDRIRRRGQGCRLRPRKAPGSSACVRRNLIRPRDPTTVLSL
jgi:SHS family lactate transporter-like MFS transporter